MATKKYNKKKHLPLKVSSAENWEELHQTPRTYRNTNANWKSQFVDMPQEDRNKLMFKYALLGNKKMLKFLFENCDCDFNTADSDGNTPLMLTIKSGSKEATEYVLKHGANPNYINNLGFSPLHLAVRKNNIPLVRALLENDANINIVDAYNQVAIFDAVQENNAEMIDYLYENGAEINFANQNGHTPLMVASFDKHRQEVLCELLRLGADVNAKDKIGRTAFMHAINNNNGAMMDILLKAGSAINTVDQNEYTPIMLCAKRGNREGLRVLIARGGDVFATNFKGQTACEIARACGHPTCAEILTKAEKIYNSNLTDEQKKSQLKVFATQNRMQNSCIR